MLNLEGRVCVVVGGGTVAARKVRGLLDAGAHIVVISPSLNPEMEAMAQDGVIEAHLTYYDGGLLDSLMPLLVFAATDDTMVNDQVVMDARALGALVDATHDASLSDFTSMALVRRGDIIIGVSTGGTAPALTIYVRDQIAALIGEEYATLAAWMGEARHDVKATIADAGERGEIWRRVIESNVLALLREGEVEQARMLYESILVGGT
jgi:precorrin-2 dehydrogenase/sirohydrochlorin ferrochelatase